jgi:hypothetical protein
MTAEEAAAADAAAKAAARAARAGKEAAKYTPADFGHNSMQRGPRCVGCHMLLKSAQCLSV